MKMNRCSALLGWLIPLALTTSPALASTTQEREFHYGPERFQLGRNADGTTQVEMRAVARDYTPGHPDLPQVGEPIELPVGTRLAGVEVLGLETASLARGVRLPSAQILRHGTEPVERSTPDPALFGRAGFVPDELVRVGMEGFERGRNVAYLLVSPARWNPATGELERVDRLRVRLTLEPTTDRPLERERVVPEWEEPSALAAAGRAATLAAAGVSGGRTAQPFKAEQLPSVQGSPVAYLIVTNDLLAPVFQQLADWKTQCGVPAVVRTVSFIRQHYPQGADDAERVRAFIRDAYTRWGTKWVLLGGDTDVIPVRYGYTTYYNPGGEYLPTDLYYSCLDGNWNADGDSLFGEATLSSNDNADLLPEVYVGRAPASTVAEAQLFVNKTLFYEKQPIDDYLTSQLFFAEVLFPQDWTPGEQPWTDGAELIEENVLPILDTTPWVRYARLYENYTDTLWRAGSLPENRRTVIDSLNRGYNIAVHVGHGYRNAMHVGDDNLSNADMMGLTNGDRLINLYATNCASDAIDYPCIGEAFLKAPAGGGVTNIGSTDYDFPNYGRYYQQEYFTLLFQDSVTAVGEAQARQKLPYVGGAMFDGAERWTQMVLILLGDPELHIFTNTSRALAVTHPASLSSADTALAVHVSTGGVPLPGARVTAYKPGSVLESALTDAGGDVTLPVRPDSAGALTLTVTGFNCRPYQATLALTGSAQPLLADRYVRLRDDGTSGSAGNANGAWDAGETVVLLPVVKNTGGSAAVSVTGTLSTTDTMVTVLQASASYGTIAAGDTLAPSVGYRVRIPAYAPDQREVPFEARLNDASGHSFLEKFQLTVLAPELHHYSHRVSDVGGDGDARPDSGETDTYYVKLINQGTGSAPGVTAVLRSLDGLATVSDSSASWGTIAAGQEVEGDGFTFTPSSTTAKLLLVVSDAYGELFRQTVDLQYPAAPTNLTASGGTSWIDLLWSKASASDLYGYNVYRSLSASGPFTKVTTVPTGRTAAFTDENLSPLTNFYYKVSAVDSSGNESGLSAVTAVTTNPPSHAIFPVPTGRETPAPVAVDHIYPGYRMDIVAGSDVLYLWHPDGTAPVDADGSSETPGDFTRLGSYYAGGPSVADLDGTGKVIIGPSWNDGSVYVFDQQGHVKPGWPAVLGPGLWTGVAVGDLFGDGHKELVLGSNTSSLYALRSDGTELMDGDNNPATFGVFKKLAGGWNLGTPALAPLENNGQLAIVFGGPDGQLYAWRANGQNVPGFPQTLNGPVSASVAVGKLDGPGGGLSVVVITASNAVYAFNANGTLRSGFPVAVPSGGTSKSPSPALADMNGDGYLDIVVAGTDGLIRTIDRNGNLIPPSNVRYSAKTSAASECSPVVADINGDGHPDIVIGDENHQLAAISGADGSMLPGFPIQTGAEVKGTPALCDCDGDGKTEIVVAGWDRNVYVWDYDFPFSPTQNPPWPQFQHDAMRTGYAETPTSVGVDDGPPPVPRQIELAAPAPNPALGRTRLAYGVPAARAGESFELAVYDLSGRRVRTLGQGRAAPGRYSATWDLRDASGSPAAAGVYFARLTLGSEVRSRKLVVIR